jgi:hypothetical protein
MEEIFSSESSVFTYQTTPYHTVKTNTINIHAADIQEGKCNTGRRETNQKGEGTLNNIPLLL